MAEVKPVKQTKCFHDIRQFDNNLSILLKLQFIINFVDEEGTKKEAITTVANVRYDTKNGISLSDTMDSLRKIRKKV